MSKDSISGLPVGTRGSVESPVVTDAVAKRQARHATRRLAYLGLLIFSIAIWASIIWLVTAWLR